ncbi:hypothetical protein EMCRGX_G010519 [Ephydatia muelleri]
MLGLSTAATSSQGQTEFQIPDCYTFLSHAYLWCVLTLAALGFCPAGANWGDDPVPIDLHSVLLAPGLADVRPQLLYLLQGREHIIILPLIVH